MKETRKLSELVKVIMEAGFMGTEITMEELEEIGFDIGWFFNYEDIVVPETIRIEVIDRTDNNYEEYDPETELYRDVVKNAIQVSIYFDGIEQNMGTDEGYIDGDNYGAVDEFFELWFGNKEGSK